MRECVRVHETLRHTVTVSLSNDLVIQPSEVYRSSTLGKPECSQAAFLTQWHKTAIGPLAVLSSDVAQHRAAVLGQGLSQAATHSPGQGGPRHVKASGCACALTIAGILSSSVVHAQSWTADADVVFLKLGTSVGTADENVFDFETGTRLALSRIGASDVGFRTTWFQWDHSRTDSAVGDISLETYNLDFEIFKQLEISGSTFIELAGGVRYNESNHIYDGAPNDFKGLGGLVGLKGGLRVRENGLVYARSKFAILQGEGAHDGDDEDLNPAYQSMRTQAEIGLGYEHRITREVSSLFLVRVWNGRTGKVLASIPSTSIPTTHWASSVLLAV